MQLDLNSSNQPDRANYFCIAFGFYRRGFRHEETSDQTTKQALGKYNGPVKDLVITRSERIGNGLETRHYPRLRDPNGNDVYLAYDENFALVGLRFQAPNAQFPDQRGTVITDFSGKVLSQNLSAANTDLNQLQNESALRMEQWKANFFR